MRVATIVLAVVLAVAAPAAEQQAPPVDVTKVGPQVGHSAVAFQLPDQQGRLQTLASVAGPKGTMLVFFRSADW